MTKQLVKADVNNLAVMPDYIQTETGLGLSTRAEDNLVPFIKLLQKGSPEVNRNEDAYIEGAGAGDILLRNPDVVVSGNDGIIFQPCHHSVMWVEWHPDRGGFVANYDRENPPVDMVQAKEAKRRFYRDNGNELVETGYYAGYIYRDGEPAMQCVISLASTGHKFRKEFMSLMNRKVTKSGQSASMFTSLYRLTTQYNTNALGDWFTWKATDHAWASPEQVLAGKKLYQQLTSGEKQLEIAAEDDSGGEDDEDDD